MAKALENGTLGEVDVLNLIDADDEKMSEIEEYAKHAIDREIENLPEFIEPPYRWNMNVFVDNVLYDLCEDDRVLKNITEFKRGEEWLREKICDVLRFLEDDRLIFVEDKEGLVSN